MLLYDCAMKRGAREPLIASGGESAGGLASGYRKGLAECPPYEPPFLQDAPLDATVWTHPSAPLATHIHSGAEVAVVLEGEERRFYGELSGERSFRLLPGDVSLIPMWEPHGWEVVRENTKVVAIHFQITISLQFHIEIAVSCKTFKDMIKKWQRSFYIRNPITV